MSHTGSRDNYLAVLNDELAHMQARLAKAPDLLREERKDATLELSREIRQIKRDIVREMGRNTARERERERF